MSTHGKQIMQAVTLILEGEHNIEVKEQVCAPFLLLLIIFFSWEVSSECEYQKGSSLGVSWNIQICERRSAEIKVL